MSELTDLLDRLEAQVSLVEREIGVGRLLVPFEDARTLTAKLRAFLAVDPENKELGRCFNCWEWITTRGDDPPEGHKPECPWSDA